MLRTLFAALLALVAAPALGALETLAEIEACAQRNRPERSSHQAVTFRTVDRVGADNVSKAEIYWRRFDDGSRALIRFKEPPDLRSSSLLLIENGSRADMFMYLPELGKVRRVSSRSVGGSLFGTDFSYEDFERLQGLSDDIESRKLPDGEVEGRAVYVLETAPARGDESEYERIVSYVDHESCLPLRTEFFEKGDRLRKVLTLPHEQIGREAERWVPRLAVMSDLVDETRTELRVDESEIDVELPRKFFSERALVSSGR